MVTEAPNIVGEVPEVGVTLSNLVGPTNYRVEDSSVEAVLLSRILSGASTEEYDDESTTVGYDSSVRVTATIAGTRGTTAKKIRYNVQPRAAERNIPGPVAGTLRLDGAVKLSDVHQRDIMDAARRNAALPSSFKTIDLLAAAERLASGIAHFSTWGSLSVNRLRGGAAANVRSVLAATDNIAIDPGSVFITKKISDHLYPGAFCALAAAINGEGGTVYSDLVTIDGNGAVQLRTYRDATLARGCYEALMMIGTMYADADAGPAFALAVTRGCYKIKTLVAHSDEGGYVRNVLRRGSYNVPYGAIILNKGDGNYTGLPTPSGSIESFARLVDSILLGAGAAVALADPMVDVDGRKYPTTLTLYTDVGGTEDPGTQSKSKIQAQERLTMQHMWAIAARDWAVNYAYLIGVLFCAPGRTGLAVEALTACAVDCIGIEDSHLDVRVAVPFYFVEPTSIWPKWMDSLVTFREECGPLAVEGSIRAVPPFRGVSSLREFSGGAYTLDLDFRFARRHPILIFCEQHPRDGTASIALFSGTPNKFANVGGQGDMGARILAGSTMDTFLWGRLHSQVVGIGELLNMDDKLRLVVTAEETGLSNTGWNHQQNNVPDLTDLGRNVEYSTSRPCYSGRGALVNDTRAWSRSRSAAAQALWSAKNRPKLMSGLGVQVRPTLGEPVPYVSSAGVSETSLRLGGADLGYDGFDDECLVESGENGGTGAGITAPGNVVPIVIHNVADKGRRAARAGGPGVVAGGGPRGGGRAGPPPPPPRPPGPPAGATGPPDRPPAPPDQVFDNIAAALTEQLFGEDEEAEYEAVPPAPPNIGGNAGGAAEG